MNEMIPEKTHRQEHNYELLMGQLIIIVIVGILIAIGSGFFMGKYIGFAQGTSSATVTTPEYCSASGADGRITVKCNELGNVSLDNLCLWASPELKNKVKLVLVTT